MGTRGMNLGEKSVRTRLETDQSATGGENTG